MSIRWVDVSLPMHTDMTVWPGDPAFELKPFRRIAQGDTSNVSWVGLGTHTGTHVDAPWHGEEDGKRLHEMDTALFFGEALVLEFAEAGVIGVDDLGDSPLPPPRAFQDAELGLALGRAVPRGFRGVERGCGAAARQRRRALGRSRLPIGRPIWGRGRIDAPAPATQQHPRGRGTSPCGGARRSLPVHGSAAALVRGRRRTLQSLRGN